MSNSFLLPSDRKCSSKFFLFSTICVVIIVYTIYTTTFIGKRSARIEEKAESLRLVTREEYAPPESQSFSVLNGTKIILLLSSGLYWGMRFSMGRIGFINAGCEVNNCILTQNRSFVPGYNYDAFMVHMPTAYDEKPWILPNRTSQQIFVLFSTEPPGKLNVLIIM